MRRPPTYAPPPDAPAAAGSLTITLNADAGAAYGTFYYFEPRTGASLALEMRT